MRPESGNKSPDIIFNTQVELTSAIKATLEWNKKKIPLIAYCHYPALWKDSSSKIPQLDESLNQGSLCLPIVFSILSAFVVSDEFIIQSNFAKSLIDEALSYFNVPHQKDIIVSPPPADPLLFSNRNLYLADSSDKKVFFYNHRLYKTYGTESFISLFNKIYSKYNKPCVVSDPMSNRSKERSAINSTPLFFRKKINSNNAFLLCDGNVDREAYKNNILRAVAGFAPLRKACVWSMASIDCMSLGVPVIAPKYASFPEFIPKDLLYETEKGVFDICDQLLSNESFRQRVSQECFEKAKLVSPNKIAQELRSVFEKHMKRIKCVE